MTSWRVADLLEYSGDVRSSRGRLMAGEQEIVLAETAAILFGTNVTISTGAIALAAKFSTCLVVCDWRGRPLAVSSGFSANSRVAARHRSQAELSLPRRKNAWMRIVRAKISGQASNLALRNSHVSSKLSHLERDVRSGDPQNLEAQAARMYWSRMFDTPGFSRVPGGSDGANSLLDYGYAVVRALVIRSIVASGLIPALGIWHSNRANAFVLADDLLEPFRPAVDHVVRRLPGDAWLSDPGIKKEIVSVLRHVMAPGADTVQTEVARLAQQLGRYAEGQVEVLNVPRWEAPN